ncbi:dolichol kinase [Thermoplasmatales archaeon SG8-52-1]|nr:MAG: dolichol kinase [Thermoplasmatales archaeon SG8-52-1]
MVNVADKLKDAKKRINSLDFDAHWYRRAFHSFGASFLIYYLLPDFDWINLLKLWIPPLIVLFVIFLEVFRLSGKISSNYFFGLRMYEKKRVGSYVFFAVAILILLRFFPQQIAIPCILCATLGDPIIGEIRRRYSMNYVYIIGFFICMYFFIITWFKADVFLIILVSVVGGLGALIGEIKKFWWLDDDFMIQMLPALLLLIIWVSIPYLGLSYPGDIIYPSGLTW